MPRLKKDSSVAAPEQAHDVPASDQKYWRFVFKKVQDLFEDYGFERFDTPMFEMADVYADAGMLADPAQELLVTCKDAKSEYVLRHSHTIGIARAYATEGLQAHVHPLKFYFSGPVIGRQNGKLCQHYQMGIMTIGDASEVIDSEQIFLGYKILTSLGFENFQVKINTIGDQNCRPSYIRALKDFYKTRLKKVCAQCRNDLKTNVLLLLRCQEESCREVAKDAPQSVDFLDETCRLHFKRILEFLDSAKIPYLLDPTLVRSDDYASRTVFEFWPEEGSNQGGPILSGGRIDRLVESVAGPRVPAAFWALNADLIVNELKSKSVAVPDHTPKPKVFLVQLGDAAKRKSLLLFEDIRRSGIEIKYSLSRDSLKAQLRIASRLGVRFTLLFGQKEAIESTVIVREMEGGIQETIPLEKIIDELKKRLRK